MHKTRRARNHETAFTADTAPDPPSLDYTRIDAATTSTRQPHDLCRFLPCFTPPKAAFLASVAATTSLGPAPSLENAPRSKPLERENKKNPDFTCRYDGTSEVCRFYKNLFSHSSLSCDRSLDGVRIPNNRDPRGQPLADAYWG